MNDISEKARTEIKKSLSVEEVLQWAIKNISDFKYELIIQDEYSHDLVIKINPEFYLVYNIN